VVNENLADLPHKPQKRGADMNEQETDEMRRRIQESLIEAKRNQLRDEYGMQFDYMDSELAPEAKNEWFDYLLEFERQFENAPRITVRERIGNPPIQPVEAIPLSGLEEAVNGLLDLLAEQNIVVDFLGEWDDLAAYRFITEELLDEEMDDIRIEEMRIHFDAATPEYDVQMWVEHFVWDVFWQEREFFLSGLESQPLFDEAGKLMPTGDFIQKLKNVWARVPATKGVNVKPITTQIVGDEGMVTAVITWKYGEERKKVESSFRLQPSHYGGWDVVYTSLLDDLLKMPL
jgi:hypothetical protein